MKTLDSAPVGEEPILLPQAYPDFACCPLYGDPRNWDNIRR